MYFNRFIASQTYALASGLEHEQSKPKINVSRNTTHLSCGQTIFAQTGSVVFDGSAFVAVSKCDICTLRIVGELRRNVWRM